MKPYEGKGRPGTKARHAAQAPWPTCSCKVCRAARYNADRDRDAFQEAVDRWHGKVPE